MPSAREIRRRIRSIRNTSQITKAMEMVSAAKLRRAQQNALASRPYAEQLADLIGVLSTRAQSQGDTPHPLLQRRPVRHSTLLFVTPDRGLTGSLVGNLLRAGAGFVAERDNPAIVAVGRKGRDWMARRGRNVIAEFSGIGARPSIAEVAPIARLVTDHFVTGMTDEVTLIFARFHSMTTQRPIRIQLLPIEPTISAAAGQRYGDFLFEPSPDEVLAAVLPRHVEVQIYQALLEANASEHAARMVAMHNATENAKDIVRSLTLTYNKARQAGITKEILEIASGAEALRAAS
ncbi:MAG: ATP synthase F1 subunit gamma [Chloroflexota bacterium]|nr:MAG: ATP synthase F1 subunit gamma [Chloroflexota bacterium]